jgi:hypothetical protein
MEGDDDDKKWASLCPKPHFGKLCHLGDGKISGGTSLNFLLIKLERKLMFDISFQQLLISSMIFLQT